MTEDTRAIMVTGASGLLGANFMQVARSSGRKVCGTYHQYPMHSPETTILQADLTKRSEVEKLFNYVRPTHVLHCAALTNVDWCEIHPEEAWQVNVNASHLLAQVAHEYSARLLFISTDSVFNGETGTYSEDDRPEPINVYARTKLAAEQAILKCSPENMVIRTNIFGWNLQDKLSLAEWMLKQLESGSIFYGFNDVVFSPLLVNDLSRLILQALDHDLTGLYHVASSQAISKYEFAREIASAFSLDPKLVTDSSINNVSFEAERPLNTSLKVNKIQASLGIAMPEVRSGILAFKDLREKGYVTSLKTQLGGQYNV